MPRSWSAASKPRKGSRWFGGGGGGGGGGASLGFGAPPESAVDYDGGSSTEDEVDEASSHHSGIGPGIARDDTATRNTSGSAWSTVASKTKKSNAFSAAASKLSRTSKSSNASTKRSRIPHAPEVVTWFNDEVEVSPELSSDALDFICGKEVGMSHPDELHELDEEHLQHIESLLPLLKRKKFRAALARLGHPAAATSGAMEPPQQAVIPASAPAPAPVPAPLSEPAASKAAPAEEPVAEQKKASAPNPPEKLPAPVGVPESKGVSFGNGAAAKEEPPAASSKAQPKASQVKDGAQSEKKARFTMIPGKDGTMRLTAAGKKKKKRRQKSADSDDGAKTESEGDRTSDSSEAEESSESETDDSDDEPEPAAADPAPASAPAPATGFAEAKGNADFSGPEDSSSEEETSSDEDSTEPKKPSTKLLLKANATDRLFVEPSRKLRRTAPPIGLKPNMEMSRFIKQSHVRIAALSEMADRGQKLSKKRRYELQNLLIARSMRSKWNKLRAAAWFVGQLLRWRKLPAQFLAKMGQPHDTQDLRVSAGFGAYEEPGEAPGIPRAQSPQAGEAAEEVFTLYKTLVPRQKVSPSVLTAVDRSTGQRIAIKKVKDAVTNPRTAMMLTRDIFLMRNCAHECITEVQDVILPNTPEGLKDIHFVMPLMSTDLGKVISSRDSIDQTQLPWVAYQCICALKYLHSAAVLHADLSPESFLIDMDSHNVKLYGFSKARSAREVIYQRPAEAKTESDEADDRTVYSLPVVDGTGQVRMKIGTEAMQRRKFGRYYEDFKNKQPDKGIEGTWQNLNRSMDRTRRANRKKMQEMEHASLRSMGDVSNFRNDRAKQKREMQAAIAHAKRASELAEWERVAEVARLRRDEVQEKGSHRDWAISHQAFPPEHPEATTIQGARLPAVTSPSALPAIDRITKRVDLTEVGLRDDISVNTRMQRDHDEAMAEQKALEEAEERKLRANAARIKRVEEARVAAERKREEEERARAEAELAALAAVRAKYTQDIAFNMQPDEIMFDVFNRDDVQHLAIEFNKQLALGEDSVDVKGFKDLIKLMGKLMSNTTDEFQVPSDRDLAAAFELADKDHSGGVDVEEFLMLYAKVKKGEAKGLGGTFLGNLFAPRRAKARDGEEKYKDGSVYRGGLNKKGQREGAGKFIWASTDAEGRIEYEGTWKNGERDGEGTQRWSNGNLYAGQWSKDMMEGNGSFEGHTGQAYTGEWKANEKHGQGTMTWPSGDIYAGGWRNDMPFGHGRKDWANKSSYEGEWKDGKKHGRGTQCWGEGAYNGDKYTGEWYEGKRAGQGEYSGTKGKSYIGGWEGDQKSGYGTYVWPNGRSYTGDWLKDKRHGKGKQSWTEGAKGGDYYDGEWIDGEPNGEGSYYEKRAQATENYGCTYTGQFLAGGKKNGLHRVVYDTGDAFEVTFDNGNETRQIQVEWARVKIDDVEDPSYEPPLDFEEGHDDDDDGADDDDDDDDDVSALGEGTVGGGAPAIDISDDGVSHSHDGLDSTHSGDRTDVSKISSAATPRVSKQEESAAGSAPPKSSSGALPAENNGAATAASKGLSTSASATTKSVAKSEQQEKPVSAPAVAPSSAVEPAVAEPKVEPEQPQPLSQAKEQQVSSGEKRDGSALQPEGGEKEDSPAPAPMNDSDPVAEPAPGSKATSEPGEVAPAPGAKSTPPRVTQREAGVAAEAAPEVAVVVENDDDAPIAEGYADVPVLDAVPAHDEEALAAAANNLAQAAAQILDGGEDEKAYYTSAQPPLVYQTHDDMGSFTSDSFISALTENFPDMRAKHKDAALVDRWLATDEPEEYKLDDDADDDDDYIDPVGAGVYVPPEVLRKTKKYDQQSEMWILGCILAEIMCYQPLRHSPETEMYRLVENDPVRIASHFRASDDAQDLVFGLLMVDPTRRMNSAEAVEHPYMSTVRRGRLEIPATFHADLVDSHMLRKVHINLTTGQQHLFHEIKKVRNRRDNAIHSRAEKAAALLRRCVEKKPYDHDDITHALRYNTAAGSFADSSLVTDAWKRLSSVVRRELPKPKAPGVTGDPNANKRALFMLRPYLKPGYDIVGSLPTMGDLFSVPLQKWSCIRTDKRGLMVLELNLESCGLVVDVKDMANKLLQLHGLETLNLSHNWGLCGELYNLNNLVDLRELNLKDTSVGGELAGAETLVNLEMLDVRGTRVFGNDGLQPLRKCNKLRYLNIDGLNIQGTVPVSIGNAIGLELHATGAQLEAEEVPCTMYGGRVQFCLIPSDVLLQLDRFVPFDDDFTQEKLLFVTETYHPFLEWTFNNRDRTAGRSGTGVHVLREEIAWISHRWLSPPSIAKRKPQLQFQHGRLARDLGPPGGSPRRKRYKSRSSPASSLAGGSILDDRSRGSKGSLRSKGSKGSNDTPKKVTFGEYVPNDTPGAGMGDTGGAFDTPVPEVPDVLTPTIPPLTTLGMNAKHPDDDNNSRLLHLQRIVKKNPNVKYWWVDFMCAPSKGEDDLLNVADALPHLVKCCGKMIVLIDNRHVNPRAHLSDGPDGWLDGGWCRLERLAAAAPFEIDVDDETDMRTILSFGPNPGSTISLETDVFVCRADDPLLKQELVPPIREPGHCDPLDGFFWDDESEVTRRNDAMRKDIERGMGVELLDMEWEAAAEREDLVPAHLQTRRRLQAPRDMLFNLFNTSIDRDRQDQKREDILDLVQLIHHGEDGHDDRQTLLELTQMLSKEIRASWDLTLSNPFDWTYTRFGLTNEFRDEVQHVVADESGSCVVRLNLRACGPLDCFMLGPCLERMVMLNHLDLAENPDLTGDLAALNGLVYLSTLDVSGCPGITGSLHSLSGLLSITSLNVSNSPGVTGVLSSLAGLENLLELDVTGCPEITGDVSTLWRAIPKCVVRHEVRHTPSRVNTKDDVLGAVLEEDLVENVLDGTAGLQESMIFSERAPIEDAIFRASQPKASTYLRGEPAIEPTRGGSPGGWGSGRW